MENSGGAGAGSGSGTGVGAGGISSAAGAAGEITGGSAAGLMRAAGVKNLLKTQNPAAAIVRPAGNQISGKPMIAGRLVMGSGAAFLGAAGLIGLMVASSSKVGCDILPDHVPDQGTDPWVNREASWYKNQSAGCERCLDTFKYMARFPTARKCRPSAMKAPELMGSLRVHAGDVLKSWTRGRRRKWAPRDPANEKTPRRDHVPPGQSLNSQGPEKPKIRRRC